MDCCKTLYHFAAFVAVSDVPYKRNYADRWRRCSRLHSACQLRVVNRNDDATEIGFRHDGPGLGRLFQESKRPRMTWWNYHEE